MLRAEPKHVLSKETLYSEIGQDRIFERFLGYFPEQGKQYTNPLRVDRNPGCSFFKSSQGEWFFRDWALGQSYSPVDVVMEMYSLNFINALFRIAKEFGLPVYGDNSIRNNTITEKDSLPGRPVAQGRVKRKPKVYEMSYTEWTPNTLSFWEDYYINEQVLEAFNVKPLEWVRLNGNVVYSSFDNPPAYVYALEQGPKFYFPFRKKFRFMGKPIEQKSTMVDSDTLFITKSYKDVMVLSLFGIDAIAPPSESYCYREAPIETKGRKRIVVNGDNDDTGRRFMDYHSRAFGWEPWTIVDREAKDVSDFIKLYGKENTKRLLEKI